MSLDQSEVGKFVGKESNPIRALDEVSKSDIRHWREFMEGIRQWNTDTAPPTMMMAWAMDPLWPKKAEATEPHEQALRLLDDAGYTGAIGIKLEQEYLQPVHLGDRLSFKVKVVSVSSAEEETKMGKGYLVNLLYTFTNQKGEVVSTQNYTILKFKRLAPVS